jgi:hypothetical protein
MARISPLCGFQQPPAVSKGETLEALKFTKQAANKAVAYLTLGPPDQGGKEIQLYQIACLAIRAAVEQRLYGKLGLPFPPRLAASLSGKMVTFDFQFGEPQVSRTTSAGFLSSRIPTKVQCLRCPASVHSTNATFKPFDQLAREPRFQRGR